MNHYTLSEIRGGLTERFTVRITQEMVDAFCKLSGDVNPLHIDADYARKSGYPDRVVFGMLTASFYSTLAGMYLPGEYCLLHEVTSKFTNPVFVGDTLDVSGTVLEIDERFKRILIKVRIVNQKGQTVSRGQIVTGVRDGA